MSLRMAIKDFISFRFIKDSSLRSERQQRKGNFIYAVAPSSYRHFERSAQRS